MDGSAPVGSAQWTPARVGLTAAGIAALVAVVAYPGLWVRSEVFGPPGRAAAVGAAAVLLLAAAWGTVWQRSVALLSVALVGQAGTLELVHAPPWGVYQHYLPWGEMLAAERGGFLLGLELQSAVIIGVALAHRKRIWNFAKRMMTPREYLGVGLILGFAAITPAQSVGRSMGELGLVVWVTVVNVLNLGLAVAAIPDGALDRIMRTLRRHITFGNDPGRSYQGWDRRVAWIAGAWVTLLSSGIAWFVFERVPHIPDDISYLFHAKYFAAGNLYLPAPPDSASFAVVGQVFNDGIRWMGNGFPGWPAVLSLGVRAGVPWLVNPLVAGGTVVLAHRLLWRLTGPTTAHAAAGLLAVSPWYLFTSASFMTHSTSLLWALAALFAIDKARGSNGVWWGLLAGLVLGLLFLTRPLEGLLVGGVLGLWALGLGGKRLSIPALAAVVLVGGVVASADLLYNARVTGDPFYAPHMKWTDSDWYPGADKLGFGPDRGNVGWPHIDPFPGHGLRDVVLNTNRNAYAANFELFGWVFGSISLAAVALILRGVRRRHIVFLGILLAVAAGHSVYWFSGGPDFGARYWYQTLVPLVVLTVVGARALAVRLGGDGRGSLVGARIGAFVALACVVAFLNVMPWRALGKYYRYRGVSADIRRLDATHGFGHSLVFVQSEYPDDYSSAFIFNPWTLDMPGTIFAKDVGPEHRRVLQDHFPDRTIWFVGRSPDSGDRLTVLRGPLDSGAAND